MQLSLCMTLAELLFKHKNTSHILFYHLLSFLEASYNVPFFTTALQTRKSPLPILRYFCQK